MIYKIRLRVITTRIENSLVYKFMLNENPEIDINYFYNQKIVQVKLFKDLNQEWDFPESRFFRAFSEEDKYTRYFSFLLCVYIKFRENPKLDLQGCWDKYFEKFSNSLELSPNLDINDIL